MASIQSQPLKNGGRAWRVRIKYTYNGVQRVKSKHFLADKYTKKDVQAWARKKEIELLAGKDYEKEAELVSLAQITMRYIEEYESRGEWGRTKSADLRHLCKYAIAKKPAAKLKARDFIEHIQDRRDSGCAASTANNDLVWWRIVYKMAIGAWELPLSTSAIDSAVTVCRQQKLISKSNNLTRRPSLAELEAILDLVIGSQGKIPMAEIICFQIFSARRIGETCRLRWDDLKEKSILVRDMKDPKGSKGNDVWVSLPEQAMDIIKRQPRQGDLIFPYNSKSIGSSFLRNCKVAGVKDLRIHDLRHEGTSWLFETGLDIPRVSKVTGHRSWGCLQRYAHLEGIEAQDKYEGWRWARGRRPAMLSVV